MKAGVKDALRKAPERLMSKARVKAILKCLLNPIPGLELLPALVGQPLRDGLVQPRQLPLDLGQVGDVLPVGEVSLPVAAGQPHEELHARVARRVLEGDSMGFIIAFIAVHGSGPELYP